MQSWNEFAALPAEGAIAMYGIAAVMALHYGASQSLVYVPISSIFGGKSGQYAHQSPLEIRR